MVYRIGEIKLFKDNEGYLLPGEIVGLLLDDRIIMKVVPDEDSELIWEYHVISEDQIVILDVAKSDITSFYDDWIIFHKKEINEAFGKNVWGCALIVYDQKEDLPEEFGDFMDSKWYKEVAGRWVFVLG